MLQMSKNRKLSGIMVCMSLGTALIVANSSPVRAEDGILDGKIANKVLSTLGLSKSNDEPGIEYKERPPLVVPATRDLPQPVPADAERVRNAAWPVDSDQRRAGGGKRRERTITYNHDTAGVPTAPPESPADGQSGIGSVWKGVVGFTTSLGGEKTEVGTFVQEPSRNALTDPPAGYRTPSNAAVYGINTKQKPKVNTADTQAAIVDSKPPR